MIDGTADLPQWHLGECLCEEGEFQGYKVHTMTCQRLACVLGECNCDEVAEEQAWRDHQTGYARYVSLPEYNEAIEQEEGRWNNL